MEAVEHAVLDQTNVDELRLKNGGYELVFLDQLLFDFDAFAGIDCLHDPLYPWLQRDTCSYFREANIPRTPPP